MITRLHDAIRKAKSQVLAEYAENNFGGYWAAGRFEELMIAFADAQAALPDDARVEAAPLPSAPEQEAEEMLSAVQAVADAYQIVGSLADFAGVFGHPDVQRALDYLNGNEIDGDILPWPREKLRPAPPDTEIASRRAENAKLREALKASQGYMTNALIDLQTRTKKITTIVTLVGGIRRIEAALASEPKP